MRRTTLLVTDSSGFIYEELPFNLVNSSSAVVSFSFLPALRKSLFFQMGEGLPEPF